MHPLIHSKILYLVAGKKAIRRQKCRSMGVAIYSGMWDIARAEQVAQLERIYAQKAEQTVIEQTVKYDFDEVDYQKWLEWLSRCN